MLTVSWEIKKTLLIQLAHLWLSPLQLKRINEAIDTPEAFYKLFLIMICDERYSKKELESFIYENKRYINEIEDYKKHLKQEQISSERIKFVDSILQMR